MRLRISTSWQMPQKAKEKRLFCVCAPHSPLHVNMMVDSSIEERGERDERPGRAILIHRGWKYETRRKEMPSLNQKLMFCFKESAIVWKTMPKVILKTFHTEKKNKMLVLHRRQVLQEKKKPKYEVIIYFERLETIFPQGSFNFKRIIRAR